MKTISISGQNFEINTPYTAGHAITEVEAKVLNQTRAENVGNNFRKMVKEALETGKLAEVTAAIAEYDASYTFAFGGGVARTPIDPIEAEAFRIAKEVVKARLAEKGHKVKDYTATEVGASKYQAAVEKVASQDDTIKLAKQRVANRKKVQEVASDDLGLDA